MARLDSFTLTLDMSPLAQNLFDIEPLEFDEDSVVVGANSLEITGVSLINGQSFLIRAFFTITSQTQAVVHGFDVVNSDGSPAASVTGLDFPVSIATDPFGLGLASFLSGSDEIFGAAGDDAIFGGSGNDVLGGGAGSDTAIYLGSSDQYDVQTLGGQVQVSDTIGSRDGADPVFRFFNSDTGVHFYTISTDERDAIVADLPQFVLEGEAYFAHDTAEAGTIPLFRFFNNDTGTHFYSASEAERDAILESLPQFTFEGTAYFVEGIA